MEVLLFPIVSAALAAFITALIRINYEKRKVDEMRKSFLKPVYVPPGQKRNSIILLGLGGSGKTTLIKELLQDPNANPYKETENYAIYRHERAGGRIQPPDLSENLPKHWLYISDYKGQNVGQLVRSFILQQKEPYSPMAYGFITSLILIVDLWPPKKHENDPDPIPQKTFKQERVNRNIEQWNQTALDAIFGLITDQLKYVCLFVNKVDLMLDVSPEAMQNYISIYKDLANRIKERSGSAEFEVLLGSAQKGASLNILTSKLLYHSIVDRK